jgi:ATP-binding cassette subfamily F protein uup
MLSGGERNRLLLARLFARPSNLLIMDEPTNDLDSDTLELLEAMVAQYAGTLLLVSHDRAFLDNVVTSTLVFEGEGRINEYVGGYSDWLEQRRTPESPKSSPKIAAGVPSVASPASGAKKLRLSYNEQRELTQLPDKIQRLEAEQAQLTALISDPSMFQGNNTQGNQALQRLHALSLELEGAYARWEVLDTLAGASRA